jgi:cytochrome c heme-lyase
MFWNALVRKNKADGVKEDDMNMVVSIHNEMNERAWRQLLQWEHGLHRGEHLDGEPSLRRFMGKPYDLSPKAKLKSFFGYGFPFDRHDWFVDRDGKEVRYVIDYYFNAAPDAKVENTIGKVHTDRGELPVNYTSTIFVDVRPAVDDVSSAWDRLRLFPRRALDALARPRFFAEGLDPARAPKEAAAFALHSSDNLPKQPQAVAPAATPAAPAAPAAAAPASPGAKATDAMSFVDAQCRPRLEALMSAADDESRATAHVDFTACMGRLLCPEQAAAFRAVLARNAAAGTEGQAGGEEEAAFAAMSKCVTERMIKRRAAAPAPAEQMQ